jgi:serine/threonine protein kinase
VETEDNIIEPGTVIDGKYKIGRVIGSGGMGAVYEAEQLDLGGKAAIKLLHAKFAKSPKIIDRFHQEAKLAGAIDHDNICRVVDHGTDQKGAPYLVMPLLSGRSLAEMLAEKKPLSQMRVIDIVCQTLSALAAAHREKIVHRDLKPDNIFITQVGDREDFVKLLDFGVSKVLEQESVSTLTSTGMVLGTAYYLAPEQARGSKRIDHRVDIFAMGVILYEALTGCRPFEGETYNEVVFKIAGDPVKTPRAINPLISRRVEQIILKAMAVDPGDRFADAQQMCAALEQAMVEGSFGKGAKESDTLADTMADTGTEGPRQTTPPALNVVRLLSRVAIAVFIAGIIGAAATIALRTDTDTSSLPEAGDEGKDKARLAPNPPDSESNRLVDAPKELSTGDQAKVKSPSALVPNLENTQGQNTTVVLESKEPSTKKNGSPAKSAKHKTGQKSSEENVIKGKGNTTFVFQND